MIVLIVSCFLARFKSRPQDGRKGGHIKVVTEEERKKSYKGEGNGK